MPVGDITGPIALIVAAATILLYSTFVPRRHQSKAALIAFAGCVASGALIAVTMARTGQRTTFSGTWSLDHVAGWSQLIILAATALTVVLSPEWMRTDARHGEWYALVLFSAAGAMAMAASTDMLELIVAVLLSSVTGYVLAAYHRRSALSVEAGAKYFLIGVLTNTMLLIGVTVLFGAARTTTYATAATALRNGASPTALVAGFVFVTIGLSFKIGAVPAQQWVPDVAQGAPAPAAAFLTVVPKIGGVVALARLVQIMPDHVIAWRTIIAIVAAITMTVGNLAALWQDDVRRLLGWSSVSQAGYALMAIPVLARTPDALPALVFFLAAYAAAQIAAFGVVTELRGRTELQHYRGLGARRPLLAVALGLALLSMVGIPPLAGFTGKLLLLGAAIDGGFAWLAAVAVANTVISLFYYLRVIAPMAFDTDPAPVPILGRWAAVATGAATAAVVALGIGSEPLLHALRTARLLP